MVKYICIGLCCFEVVIFTFLHYCKKKTFGLRFKVQKKCNLYIVCQEHTFLMQFCSFINFLFDQSILAKQIKSTHAITSIKQSPVFKGHLFNCPVIEDFIWIELLLRVRLSYKAMFSLSQKWPLNTCLTVFITCVLYMYITTCTWESWTFFCRIFAWDKCNKFKFII
jgi:hypothetical protein